VQPHVAGPELVITEENSFFKSANVIVTSAPPSQYYDANGDIVIS
jgi:hypothetical protein